MKPATGTRPSPEEGVDAVEGRRETWRGSKLVLMTLDQTVPKASRSLTFSVTHVYTSHYSSNPLELDFLSFPMEGFLTQILVLSN